LFCICHGDFCLPSAVDIEHATPFADFRNNQQRLLDYLNKSSNELFTDYFLTLHRVSDYFRRDTDDAVKATGYFYKLCYNSIDNLYLLCHACNLRKSDKPPLDWFAEETDYFGQGFVNAVNALGGLHSGLLFHRIHQVSDKMPTLTFLDGSMAKTPQQSQGLGSFVREWFFSNYHGVFEENKAIYRKHYFVLKSYLKSIVGFIQEGKVDNAHKAEVKAKKALRRFKEENNMAIETLSLIVRNPQETSSHSSDSDKTAEINARRNTSEKMTYGGAISTRAINSIQHHVRRVFGDSDFSVAVTNKCLELDDELHLIGTQWDNIFQQVLVMLTKEAVNKAAGKALQLSKDDFMKEIITLYNTEKDKSKAIQNYKKEIKERDRVLHEKDEVIHEKDVVIHEKDVVILEKDKQLALEHEESLRKDKMLLEKDEVIHEKDVVILEKDKQLHEKDEQIERERERFRQQVALLQAERELFHSRSPSSSSPTNPTLFSPTTQTAGKKRGLSSNEVSKRHKADDEPDESSNDYNSPPSPKQ